MGGDALPAEAKTAIVIAVRKRLRLRKRERLERRIAYVKIVAK
jgi:hypothetical protein